MATRAQMEITAKVFQTRKLRGGPEVIRETTTAYLESIKVEATNAVRTRMREGVSAELGFAYISERESLFAEVLQDEGNPRLRIGSHVIQAAVDERGRVPSSLPPFGPGTMLRFWVMLKLDPDPKKMFVVSRGVAKAIAERGLPRADDMLREPFKFGFQAMKPQIVEGLRRAGTEATTIIKKGDIG